MGGMVRRGAGVAIAAWACTVFPAFAIGPIHLAQSNDAADHKAIQQGDDLTKRLVDPGNGGVGGTGLGKLSKDPSGAGTGQSVKGRPGSGVDPDAPKPNL